MHMNKHTFLFLRAKLQETFSVPHQLAQMFSCLVRVHKEPALGSAPHCPAHLLGTFQSWRAHFDLKLPSTDQSWGHSGVLSQHLGTKPPFWWQHTDSSWTKDDLNWAAVPAPSKPLSSNSPFPHPMRQFTPWPSLQASQAPWPQTG